MLRIKLLIYYNNVLDVQINHKHLFMMVKNCKNIVILSQVYIMINYYIIITSRINYLNNFFLNPLSNL